MGLTNKSQCPLGRHLPHLVRGVKNAFYIRLFFLSFQSDYTCFNTFHFSLPSKAETAWSAVANGSG